MAHVHPSFPLAPVPHQPSSIGFGFGFPRSQTVSSPAAHSFGFGAALASPARRPQPQHASSSPSTLQRFSPSPVPSAFTPSSHVNGLQDVAGSSKRQIEASQSSNSKRRARDSDDDNDDDHGGLLQVARLRGSSNLIGGRRTMRGLKKSRMDGAASVEDGGFGQSTASSSPSSSPPEVDVGVLLALLPSSSLLPILTSLVTKHPSLQSDLIALIPTPSLTTALDALRAAENNVRETVPFGFSLQAAAQGQGVSEAYVLSRVQGPVGELASLIQAHLPFFTKTPTPHPSTTFPYLHATTQLLLRLSSSLPAPLVALDLLWTRIADEWLKWVQAVSTLVNKEGGMVAAGVADSWVRELDACAAKSSNPAGNGTPIRLEDKIRSQIGVVRDRWVGEVGWMVGRRLEQVHQVNHGDVGMGGMDEEL